MSTGLARVEATIGQELATAVSESSARIVVESEASTQTAQWYAVYTNANHEKRVAEQFANRCIDHFLPQYEKVSRWKDRRVLLQRPLFPGYLFVHLALHNRLRVQQVPGVVGLVGFSGVPTAVPEEEVRRVREL